MQCQVFITKVSYKHKNSLQLTEMYLLIFTVGVSFGNKNMNTFENIYIFFFISLLLECSCNSLRKSDPSLLAVDKYIILTLKYM